MRHISYFTAFLIWHTQAGTLGKTLDTEIDLRPVSVCSATTINHITQPLPQQCLRTDWARLGPIASADGSVTASNGKRSEETFAVIKSGENTSEVGDSRMKDEIPVNAASDAVMNTLSNNEDHSDPTNLLVEPGIQQEEDGDPLGDRSTFLSFEDWKAQMLEKADRTRDYSSSDVHGSEGTGQIRKRQPGIENGLDSLGDEGEIELDFSGFVTSETTPGRPKDARGSTNHELYSRDGERARSPVKKSKEAGTTGKERFNYASFDCAATVLKTNQGSKGATWILSENKDSYLLNKCSQKDKYFIVEMCNDILIDTIVLGNFEFFSSTFRHFRVSISDRYPVKAEKWREIGTFEARNQRGVQAFLIENGLTWVRYLKVELLTHYGKEYYCPVSLLRVHGKTMFDDIRHEVREPNDQDEGDDDDDTPAANEGQADKATALLAVEPSTGEFALTSGFIKGEPPADLPVNAVVIVEDPVVLPQSQIGEAAVQEASASDQNSAVQPNASIQAPLETGEVTEKNSIYANGSSIASNRSSSIVAQHSTSQISTSSQLETVMSSDHEPTSIVDALDSDKEVEHTMLLSTFTLTDNMTSLLTEESHVDSQSVKTDTVNIEPSISPERRRYGETDSPIGLESSIAPETETTRTHTYDTLNGVRQTDSAAFVASKNKGTKSPTPIKAASAHVPATQDSFFRSVHRRLQMLESNSSLSLQYIEEQSRSLRDAFAKAEKRQLLRTSNFLETLNSTVLGELKSFRSQYDQIWQSTVLELASQREQSQNEVRALGERLGILADELVWQKRVVYLQFVLFVLCLGLVIFSRNGVAGSAAVPLELSLLQSIQHLKRRDGLSVSFAKRYPSFLDSPIASPSRPESMGGFFDGRKRNHRRHLSDGITSGEETGFGTGVTASPDTRPSSRRHLPLRNSTHSIVSEGDPQSPTVVLRPADESSSPSPNEEGGKNDDVPEVDPLALKRAASSPMLGRTIREGSEEPEIGSAYDDEVVQRELQAPDVVGTLPDEQQPSIQVEN